MTANAAPRTIELESAPSLVSLFARSPLAARRRSRDLPDVELRLPEVTTDPAHLARYDRVCGFALRDVLPPTFVHVLAFPLQVALMVDHPFPLSLPKLVHIANRITVHRAITADERLSITVRAENLRAHPKGSAIDLVADATVDGDAVWHGVSTYLQRGGPPTGHSPAEDGDGATATGDAAGDATEHAVPDEPAAVWTVPRDIGRRYAAVSGDRNPIHLHPLPAKLAGFPRTIAHGMWTKARSVAAVESRLPAAYTVDVAFKKPVVLPATVGLHTAASRGIRAIAVRDAATGAPHLQGSIVAGD